MFFLQLFYLLQIDTEPGQTSGLFLISLIFRIAAVFICRSRAKKLNRNVLNWSLFGFFLPLIAIIWIYCLGPKSAWLR